MRVSACASYKFAKVLEGSCKRKSQAKTKKGSLREISPLPLVIYARAVKLHAVFFLLTFLFLRHKRILPPKL